MPHTIIRLDSVDLDDFYAEASRPDTQSMAAGAWFVDYLYACGDIP